MKEIIEVEEKDFEDGWYRALFGEADLRVKKANGETATYHPPYPYSDAEQEMFDMFPGMVTCITSEFCFDLMRRPGEPPSIRWIAMRAHQAWDYWIEGEQDISPKPDYEFCRKMVKKYVPEGVKPPPPPRWDLLGPG